MARKRKLAAAVFSLGCLHASTLMALGLGELELESFLNEPLKANVDLLNLDGLHEEQIRIRLATSEDFARLGVERLYFLTTIRFDVVTGGAGGPRILITSEEPVLEPYLDFILEARWPTGRLLREYTVLVDPPVYSETPTVVSASERVYETEGIPAPDSAVEPAATGSKEPVGLFPEGVQRGAGDTAVKTTGTRVDIKDSSLAPGAMPQRNFNAGTAGSPAPGARYMISRDDTLWNIANRAKPSGTSVHQEMLDIQRLNPDAFINGNINRIKAGYIIYLPAADDISSSDEPAAVAEVREQNAAWREGRDAELFARRGPSLRISADETGEDEPVGEVAAADTAETGVAGAAPGEPAGEQQPGGAVPGSGESVPSGEAGADTRLAQAQEQLETLKRIVSLKDDQIAALQHALAEAGVEPGIETEPAIGEAGVADDGAPVVEEEAIEGMSGEGAAAGESPVDAAGVQGDLAEAEPAPEGGESGAVDGSIAEGTEAESVALGTETTAEPEVPAAAAPEVRRESPAEQAKPPAEPASAGGDGWASNLLYVLGALVVGALAFVLVRRRGSSDGDEDEPVAAEEPSADVFSDVKLKQQNIAVETPRVMIQTQASARDNRGYGERKHDEYASDVDASDALAEADIYIAYGRHPQAIELLNNALETEPDNPVYRLKLLEIYTELNDRGAAAAQLEKIHATGDADSIARAEAVIAGARAPAAGSDRRGLSPSPLDRAEDGDDKLESDFSGLEIEDSIRQGAGEGDLDLSGDFAGTDSAATEEEELVIAHDSNGLSTKLDLARAYLDMGDDDGARQILDEIIAEGGEELRTEAQALLNRIGG